MIQLTEREKQIEAIRQRILSEYDKYHTSDAIDWARLAAAKIRASFARECLPQTGEGWISVETERPPIDEWVLFYNGHWRGVGKYKPDEDDDYPHPPYQDENSQWIEPYPTHWQPLPAPPIDQQKKEGV